MNRPYPLQARADLRAAGVRGTHCSEGRLKVVRRYCVWLLEGSLGGKW